MNNKMIDGWAIYSDGTANESPRNLKLVNPVDVMNPIDFGELTGHRNFCSLAFETLRAKKNLVGCSALLIADWNNGMERLWIIGHDSKLKYSAHLDIGHDECNEHYAVKDGYLFVNGRQVWPTN